MNTPDPSLIASMPLFADFDREALAEFLGLGQSRLVVRSQHVFSQDQEAEAFYLLLDGYVRIELVRPNGEVVIVRFASTGELMGIAPALGRDTYPANSVAVVDCVVLGWPCSVWADTVRRYPSFATAASQTIGTRLQEAHDRIAEMATAQVEQRIASALLRLANQSGRKTSDGILIDFPISRQDLSEMTGTTLHTVSRTLSAWERRNIVRSGRKRIEILSGHQLLLIAEGRT
ncbi:MAG: Crp/Fnr family transcriptional regulator [Rhizobiaceae bacterium]